MRPAAKGTPSTHVQHFQVQAAGARAQHDQRHVDDLQVSGGKNIRQVSVEPNNQRHVDDLEGRKWKDMGAWS